MDKRYQVFVSSTYTDLKDERRKVTQTLMEMDCIPAGMELFPATDEEQWEFIKKVIDDCDYYLLIIGGRYGSTTAEGISFTEKEFDYAVEKNIRVVALLHGNPGSIPADKTESDPDLLKKLNQFRQKVSTDRLVKYWERPEDLPGMVALSLQKTIKTFPAKGWTRYEGPSNEKLLRELHDLQNENSELQQRVTEFEKQKAKKVEGIAGLDEEFTVHGTYSSRGKSTWEVTIKWGDMFSTISPEVSRGISRSLIQFSLKNHLFVQSGKNGFNIEIDEQDFNTIEIQFKVLGLITTQYLKAVDGKMYWYWNLTPQGFQKMYEMRAVKSNK